MTETTRDDLALRAIAEAGWEYPDGPRWETLERVWRLDRDGQPIGMAGMLRLWGEAMMSHIVVVPGARSLAALHALQAAVGDAVWAMGFIRATTALPPHPRWRAVARRLGWAPIERYGIWWSLPLA